MSIIRAPKVERFFYTLDKRISEDRRLSWQARGLLIYLLGKPDHWKVSVEALKAETSDSRKPTSRDGVYSIMDELSNAGYVKRIAARDESGRMAGFDYLVQETPLPDLPLTAEPITAETTLVSTDTKQGLNKAICNPQADDIPFESIRKSYQKICGESLKPAIKLTDERKKNIKLCWNYDVNGVKVFRSGNFWKLYFEHCLKNPHWRGETGTWKASLEFVTRKSVMEPTVEAIQLEMGLVNESA